MMLTKLLHSKSTVSLTLFFLAFIPRFLDLDRFLTADEFLWVDRSRNFLAGLTNPAYQCDSVVEKWGFMAEGLACTLRTGHPGVTTMWTGSFGFVLRWLWVGQPGPLHDYVTAVSTNPLDADFIAWERIGTVLIISLWVVVVYWLVRRLWGAQIALIGVLLIALDPFHIALSRVIHHDALNTTFMTLSVLCMFIYWGQPARRKWLCLSGLLAGFAFLSKSPALYLMPFVALTGLWFAITDIRRQQDETNRKGKEGKETDSRPPAYARLLTPDAGRILRRTVLDGLLWFAVAAAVFVIFWPAMWVAPVEALETVFFIGSKYATGGHAKGNYFWGEISKDPGPLFYIVSWFYRVSPLVILGVIGAVGMWFTRPKIRPTSPPEEQPAHQTQRKRPDLSPSFHRFSRYLPLILLFILGYFLLVAVSEKKQERYFLPVYPWFNLIAAGGLLSLTNYYLPFTKIIRPLPSALRPSLSILVVAVLAINGLLVAAAYPYYFTYYNPLLGGATSAEKVLTIGWGEGLDLAADYLNQKEDAGQRRVSSWYQSTFAPYYTGEAISYSAEKGKVLAGDYAIFYINQVQRRFPDDILFEYFEERFEPEKTISLQGIDYAWIYPSLGVDHYIQDQTYTGIASLLGWQWAAGDAPLIPGQPAGFELYWEYLGKELDETFFFRLVDTQGRPWVEGLSRPVIAENPPSEQWREGEIIVERGVITPPRGMPPGQYRLQIGFYTDAPAVKEGELLFLVPEDEALVSIGHTDHPAAYRLPKNAEPLHQPLTSGLTLLGAAWPDKLEAGGPSSLTTDRQDAPLAPPFFVDLYWRVDQPLPADAHLHVGLMDAGGEARQAWFNLSLAETFNDSQTTWRPGDILHTRWPLDLLPETPPGNYYLELVWPEDTSQTVSLGRLVVQ